MMDYNRYDKIMRKLLIQKNNKVCFQRRDKIINNPNKYPNINNWLKYRYKESESLLETIWMLNSGVEHRNICPVCGKSIPLVSKHAFVQIFCSQRCQRMTNALKSARQHQERMKNDPEYKKRKIEQDLETFKKNHNGISKSEYMKSIKNQIISKGKKTIKEKYGVNNWQEFGQLDEIKEKKNKTVRKKYGVDNWNQLVTIPEIAKKRKENSEKTIKERYGFNDFSELYSSNWIQEKRLETLKSHGWDSYSDMVSEKMNQLANDRSITTTPFTSKPENDLYEMLIELYPDIVRQYKDKKRYPWNCDFYIPSLDLFIEYQGFISHGGHPFNEYNEEDIIKLNEWKSKGYYHFIDGWTVKDPRKRSTAQKNNLNFLEIWPDWNQEKMLSEIKKFENVAI